VGGCGGTQGCQRLADETEPQVAIKRVRARTNFLRCRGVTLRGVLKKQRPFLGWPRAFASHWSNQHGSGGYPTNKEGMGKKSNGQSSTGGCGKRTRGNGKGRKSALAATGSGIPGQKKKLFTISGLRGGNSVKRGHKGLRQGGPGYVVKAAKITGPGFREGSVWNGAGTHGGGELAFAATSWGPWQKKC